METLKRTLKKSIITILFSVHFFGLDILNLFCEMASKKRQTVFSDGQSTSENLPSSNSL